MIKPVKNVQMQEVPIVNNVILDIINLLLTLALRAIYLAQPAQAQIFMIAQHVKLTSRHQVMNLVP